MNLKDYNIKIYLKKILNLNKNRSVKYFLLMF